MTLPSNFVKCHKVINIIGNVSFFGQLDYSISAFETSEAHIFIREWFIRSFQQFHSKEGNHIFSVRGEKTHQIS